MASCTEICKAIEKKIQFRFLKPYFGVFESIGYYCDQNSPQMQPITGQIISVHSHTPYVFKNHFNIIYQSMPKPSHRFTY